MNQCFVRIVVLIIVFGLFYIFQHFFWPPVDSNIFIVIVSAILVTTVCNSVV